MLFEANKPKNKRNLTFTFCNETKYTKTTTTICSTTAMKIEQYEQQQQQKDKQSQQAALQQLYYHGSKQLYLKDSNNAANGSLMRNGVVAPLTLDMTIDRAIECTILHGIATHFGALPIVTCVLQALIIRRALEYHNNKANNAQLKLQAPTMKDLQAMLDNEWATFKHKIATSSVEELGKELQYPTAIQDWYHSLGSNPSEIIQAAEAKCMQELAGFDTDFDPYAYFYKGVSGYCVLSLKIALWSLYWSYQAKDKKKNKITFKPTKGFPQWIFDNCQEYETVYWVVLIGADADTYGAIAGPMLAAHHPHAIPSVLVKGAQLKDEMTQIMQLS